MHKIYIVLGVVLGVFLWGSRVGRVRAAACPAGQVCKATRTLNAHVCEGSGTENCTEWSTEYTGVGDTCRGVCDGYPGVSCDTDQHCIDAYAGSNCWEKVCCKYGESISGGECVADQKNTTIACNETATACYGLGTRADCTIESITGDCVQFSTSNNDKGCCGPGGADPEHRECQGNSCVLVAGDGVNECSDNSDCAPALGCVAVTCSCESGGSGGACGSDSDCWDNYSVSGTVYLDNTGACSDTSTPVANAGNVVSGGYSGSVGGDGTYRVENISSSPCDPPNLVFTLQDLDLQYSCSCPGSCQDSVLVDGDEVYNFFVTNQQEAWWQSVGGDVGSNLGNVVSDIPSTCVEPICYPYLSRGALDSSGVITFWLGNYDFSDGSASEGVDYVAEAKIPVNRGIEGYDFFYRQFEMGIEPDDDFGIAGQSKTGVEKPGSGPLNERAYYSDGDLTLNGGSWGMVPTESVVVFVDGDLVVDTDITTPLTGFIAFVVSGDITFLGGDADSTSETPFVQGVFIADGSINVNSGTEKFIGEGIFIGWGGVVLSRDFGDASNNTDPAELFIYRPDFVSNAPDAMRRPVMRWNEVAP